MKSVKDIYITAYQVIKQHRADALEYSMMQLARMVDADDVEGGITWDRIMGEIIVHQNSKKKISG